MSGLWVVLGATLGAPARYLLDQRIQSRLRTPLPWGTLTVNVLGSLVLGVVASLVAHAGVSGWWLTVLGTGFCGAFTTFSTFSLQAVTLVELGRTATAAAYVALSLALGLGAVSLGWWLGTL